MKPKHSPTRVQWFADRDEAENAAFTSPGIAVVEPAFWGEGFILQVWT